MYMSVYIYISVQDQYGCVMRGRRLPELAAGDFDEFVQNTVQFGYSRLLERLRGLMPRLRVFILNVFESGKAVLFTEYELRFACYRYLQLTLTVMGHHDVRKARAGLVACLILRENVGRPHFWTSTLLDRGTHLRDLIVAVVQNRLELGTCAELRRFRVSSSLMSCMEIGVERLHKVLHQHVTLATNHSAAYESLGLRGLDIQSEVDAKPELLFELAEFVRSVGTHYAAIEELGLQAHPAFADLQTDEGLSKDLTHSLAVDVVYRCDRVTQFATLPAVRYRPPAIWDVVVNLWRPLGPVNGQRAGAG